MMRTEEAAIYCLKHKKEKYFHSLHEPARFKKPVGHIALPNLHCGSIQQRTHAQRRACNRKHVPFHYSSM